MKRIIFTLVLVGSMLVSAGSVFASGIGSGDQTKLHLRDGSCQTAMAGGRGAGFGAGDQIRLHLHLRDGSCQTA